MEFQSLLCDLEPQTALFMYKMGIRKIFSWLPHMLCERVICLLQFYMDLNVIKY